eukprot:14397911-Ditylum_brightwellii.AAC.1
MSMVEISPYARDSNVRKRCCPRTPLDGGSSLAHGKQNSFPSNGNVRQIISKRNRKRPLSGYFSKEQSDNEGITSLEGGRKRVQQTTKHNPVTTKDDVFSPSPFALPCCHGRWSVPLERGSNQQHRRNVELTKRLILEIKLSPKDEKLISANEVGDCFGGTKESDISVPLKLWLEQTS